MTDAVLDVVRSGKRVTSVGADAWDAVHDSCFVEVGLGAAVPLRIENRELDVRAVAVGFRPVRVVARTPVGYVRFDQFPAAEMARIDDLIREAEPARTAD